MSAVIQTRELSCFYGIVLGLNNVSLQVEEGMTGLVGPNGAGKSTLIKLITGQIRPSSGSIEVLGAAPWNNPAVLSQIGYCPEHENTHSDLKPVDWLVALGTLSGVPRLEAKERAVRALQRVQLDESHWEKRIGNYSKGMRQRVKLAQAILHEPRLVILDEPMNGLDPMGRLEIASILRELHVGGVSVLISSHILQELEALCGRFILLNWGRQMTDGRRDQANDGDKDNAAQMEIRTDAPEGLAAHLVGQGLLKGYLIGEGAVTIWPKDPAFFQDRWIHLVDGSGAQIHELTSRSASLSSLYERIAK